jgi:oxygen-independent coproporphyrinogen-3 oxidase
VHAPSAPRASVYVHFPWCLEKCPYCDFVSYRTERAAIDHRGYADAVLRELAWRAPTFEGRVVGSVFFGGGTPSLWEPAELGRVLAAIAAALPTTSDLEVTVECNPTSLDRPRVDALAGVGVNRLSIGAQSLRADALRFLGRLHDHEDALAAVDAALAARDLRVSADLIFGLPEQSPEEAAAQAALLAERGLSHLSCYQLTIEPGTRFGELARVGRLPLADDGRVAEAFLAIDEALSARGLEHYEISNYARPGEEARHNLGYWRGEEYLGLGCGAYGFVRTRGGGERWRNDVLPARWMARAGTPAAEAERERLSPDALLRERIMLGLRLGRGFDLEEAARDVGAEAWTTARRRSAEQLAQRGRLLLEGARLRVPRAAWLFTDDTAARLF